MLSIVASVDVRIYEKRNKQSVIFKTFEEIAVGETMELLNIMILVHFMSSL